MVPSSLGGRLLLLLVILTGGALLSSTYAALRAANANVTALVREELTVRSQVAFYALEQQTQALRQRVEVVAADFGFKAAAATEDRGTILSALANHGERLGADLAMMLRPNGDVLLASAPVTGLPAGITRVVSSPEQTTGALIDVLADKPYLLVASPIMAPALSGWLVIGEELDTAALEGLQQLTSAEISLLYRPRDGNLRLQTTLPTDDTGTDLLQNDLPTGWEAYGWLTEAVDLASLSANSSIRCYVSLSVDDALADYNPLRVQLVLIGGIALLLAALLATVASRWITGPINAMASIARRISDGDYTEKVAVNTGTELDALGNALSFMQKTVAEREARIKHQAQHDLLTQLPNRNYMYALYQRYLREHPQRACFGLALMEIENLQQLRDLYGSDFSDEVLREASKRVSTTLRRGDMAGRVADQQILLFLQGLDSEGLDPVVAKIEEQRKQPLLVDGVPVTLDLRLGFAFSPAHGMTFDDLERRALLALNSARSQGQEFAVYSLGQDERHLRQIRIANRLQDAVREDAFHLLYQPKYRLQDRRIIGAEALIRWDDRELGKVFPDEFILVAEQTGVITQLSEWVVQRVISDQVAWREQGLEISISVNLSGLDVLQRAFLEDVLEAVRVARLPMSALVLEVTETAMMADIDAARANMERVESMGMRISIDDYGTGFSSLAQLRSLPVRELKLDKSLIDTIEDEEGDRLIVRSTIDMAHHLGLEVVAEGIETLGVLNLLDEMHCDVLQGYLLAKPMPRDAFSDFMALEDTHTAHIRDALGQRHVA